MLSPILLNKIISFAKFTLAKRDCWAYVEVVNSFYALKFTAFKVMGKVSKCVQDRDVICGLHAITGLRSYFVRRHKLDLGWPLTPATLFTRLVNSRRVTFRRAARPRSFKTAWPSVQQLWRIWYPSFVVQRPWSLTFWLLLLHQSWTACDFYRLLYQPCKSVGCVCVP